MLISPFFSLQVVKVFKSHNKSRKKSAFTHVAGQILISYLPVDWAVGLQLILNPGDQDGQKKKIL